MREGPLEAPARSGLRSRMTTMMRLTEEQQRAVDETEVKPPQIVDPRTNEAYVLIPANDYEAVRELLDEERRQEAIHRIALRNAARRMQEAP